MITFWNVCFSSWDDHSSPFFLCLSSWPINPGIPEYTFDWIGLFNKFLIDQSTLYVLFSATVMKTTGWVARSCKDLYHMTLDAELSSSLSIRRLEIAWLGRYQVHVKIIVPVVISLRVLENIGSKIRMYKFQFSMRTNDNQFYSIVFQLCYFFSPICWDEGIWSILVIVRSSSL